MVLASAKVCWKSACLLNDGVVVRDVVGDVWGTLVMASSSGTSSVTLAMEPLVTV
jgi:hypothetical protein